MISTGECVEVDGWRYSVVGRDEVPPPLRPGPGHVTVYVTPWGGEPYLHIVAWTTLERVWSGEWPACRLGAPGRPKRRLAASPEEP